LAISGLLRGEEQEEPVGDHSVALPLDIGLSDARRRTPDMPLYTLRNQQTGDLFQTTDPGRAPITGARQALPGRSSA
jgi:hypothetical protein